MSSDLGLLWSFDLDDDDDNDPYVPPRTASPAPPSPPPSESIARRTRAHADLSTVDLDQFAQQYEGILDQADQEDFGAARRRAHPLHPSPPLEDVSELYSEELGGPGDPDELLPFAALLGEDLSDDDNDEEYVAPQTLEEDEEEYRDDRSTQVSSQTSSAAHHFTCSLSIRSLLTKALLLTLCGVQRRS